MFLPRGAALFAVALLAPATAAASPLELFGFGARSPGMAGTGVASTTGFESVYLNPAGLARVPGKRATVGGMLGDFQLERDGEPTDTDGARGLVIGGELPIPMGGVMKDRVGLGFGFHIPGVAIARVRQPFPGTPDFTILENRSHVIALQVATGIRITDRLDLGLGVITLASLGGAITVSTDSAGRFATTSEQQLLTKFAPVLGARWRLRDGLDLGAVLRAESRSDYDIQVTTDIADVVPIQLPPIQIAGTAQYDPLTVAVEAAYQVRDDLLITLQLQWQHWSSFPLPTLEPTAGSRVQEAPGFHDTVVPRTSVEWSRRLGGAVIAARAGSAFMMSPAPTSTGRQSFLDNHRLIGAIGLGVGFPDSRVPVRVDLWFQHHYLIARRHTKDAAAFEPGDPIPFDTMESSGQVLVGGLAVGLDL